MIHFAIGTKAQFIKMAPVMRLLEDDGEKYHLLDLSQHSGITEKILSDFDLKPTITSLRKTKQSVTTYMQAISWFTYGVCQTLIGSLKLRQRLFLGQNGIVLLHGDTLSTLLGLYLAKTASLKTALVEAGLSSGNLFDPFPEEWIRRHTGRKVDFLFPPDNISESWLKLRKFQCPIINTKYNTGRDSLSLIISRHSLNAGELESDGKFGVVTLHRLETLSYKPRLVRAIRHILSLARELGPLKFYMHPPTTNAMKKHGLMNEIESSAHIELHGLEPYPQFIESLMKARFILTDGGSIQEEATYLMKPCLLLRNRTERSDGVGYNATLASWDTEEDVAFLRKKIDELSQPQYRDSGMYASRIILKSIDKFRLQSNT
jgi:UDP-N-acetylglucosamine 2-epimerase (non-hydrolysing)